MTTSPLAVGIGALETIAHELQEARLEPVNMGWNPNSSPISGGATFQFGSTEDTTRAGLLLFDATVQPVESDECGTLLIYKGVRVDGIRLRVFGPRGR